MAHVSFTPRQATALVERMEVWFAEWRQGLRQARSQAELTRKLQGVDEHLLRDMGLTWTGSRFERSARDECSWR